MLAGPAIAAIQGIVDTSLRGEVIVGVAILEEGGLTEHRMAAVAMAAVTVAAVMVEATVS